MKRLVSFVLALASAAAVAAAPQPKPPVPTAIAFTQGTVTRSLNVTSPNCQDYRGTPLNGPHGLTRFRLICGNTAQGSYVQFQTDAGPIYAQWLWPEPQCGQKPPLFVQFFECPFGTHGDGFSLTHDWTCVGGVWQAAEWVPPWIPPPPSPPTPPTGACEADTPPPASWQSPRYVGSDAVPAKPAKGSSFTGPYGLATTRVTDHTTDAPGQPWLVSWYNRFQAYNADGSLFLAYESDGFWLAFDASTNALVRKLQGPAADAEIQWDATDPNVIRYLPTNGGRVLKKMNVRTGVVSVDWDFTAAVGAIFPNATRYWTKSEGSPTEDGRYWCLWAEDDAFSRVYGFVKLDIVNKAVAWSMPNPAPDMPDNVSCTPSGRWFVDAGNNSRPTIAYATDGSGRSQVLSPHKVEHGDIGKRSDGHDVYLGPDYTSGDMFAIDVDTGIRTNLFRLYNNPIIGTNYAVHPSMKAFGKPDWGIVSTYGTPPANILLVNVRDGRVFGLGADYANVPPSSYWPEPHCTVDRNMTRMLCSDNLKNTTHPLDVDVYRTDLPTLPN